MKKIKILIYIFFTINYLSCQEKNNVSLPQEIIKQENHDMIKIVLEKQLKQGANQYFDEAGVEIIKKEFENEELTACIQIVNNILTTNGFKLLDKYEFNLKVKNIFNRIIDTNSQNKYLYINYFDKCGKDFNKNPNNGVDYNGTYIIKDNNFITDFYYIPQILNYQKEYPEIAKIEDNIPLKYKDKEGDDYSIETWKDLLTRNDDYNLAKERRFNQQLLISRNKYLFNDDKSQFIWLTHNDENFMESLVTIFGYTEDKKLLKWVFDNTNLPDFYKYAKKEVLEEFEKLLWTKQCNGEIKVHQNTLDLIKELSTPENNLYIMYVAEYLTNYLEENKDLTDQQKAKIAAYLLCFGEEYKYDKRYDYNQMFMGCFFHYIDDGKYTKEFERNNYYGLPKFKEWYETAKKEKDMFNGGGDFPDSPQPLDYKHQAEPRK